MLKLFRELRIKHSDHWLLFTSVTGFLIIAIGLWLLTGMIAIPVLLVLLFLMTVVIQIHLYRQQKIDIEFQQRNIQALIDLHSRIRFRLPLPSLDNWAASPELISRIFYQMKLIRPETIVELGSGASTICCGYFVEHLKKGRVISLDHEEQFTNQTLANLHMHQLDSYIELYHAPLVQHNLKGKMVTWYDISMLGEIPDIDLLIIDGPPEKTQALARYPALPLLYSKLSRQAVIILDDASREEEQEVIKLWCRQFPDLKTEFIPSEKGICILRRSDYLENGLYEHSIIKDSASRSSS